MKKFIFLCLFLPFHLIAANIAVVSMAIGDNYIEDVMPGIDSKRAYCDMHGYDFFCASESLDPTRHVVWSKILFIKEVMNQGTYDWIFWTDADAVICNPTIKLEDLIDDNFDVIISKDFYGINAGHFFIKCCDWSLAFLDKVYRHTDCINHIWREQRAIIVEYKKAAMKTHFKIIPQRLINSYSPEKTYNAKFQLDDVIYQPGDFLIHFPDHHTGYYNLLNKYSFLNNPEYVPPTNE